MEGGGCTQTGVQLWDDLLYGGPHQSNLTQGIQLSLSFKSEVMGAEPEVVLWANINALN